MLDDELKEFSKSFHEEIRAEAHAIDSLREEVFVSKMAALLEDYGDIEEVIPASYRATGVKLDGYHYDDEFNELTLIVSHYLDEDDPGVARVSNTDVDAALKRAKNFFTKGQKALYENIEISNEAHEAARLIKECAKDIRRVKIILITDGVAPKRAADTESLEGVEIVSTLWDIERAGNFSRTGEREKIVVDFTEYCGGPLACVVRESQEIKYTTYLGFIPGVALADMYAKWGIRMLDMNVRVFLSARGNVNKGIRQTIVDEPQMFCAYNNGITVFAREIDTVGEGGAVGLLRAVDFQIVNGGQTTASLYHARKKYRADLGLIYVQMKLTVIHNEQDIHTLVPLISEYSNTQNKVQIADLAANQSPHPEIQAISNSILAPDPTGGAQQTYWFYEKSRGSYEELRNLSATTVAQKRQFDLLRPKGQKFDKIKFGKIWNTYLMLPHVVSLGGQKNFARFNEWLRDQKGEDWVSFFRKTVALLILWNAMEKIVRRKHYQGYHHNIVAYSLAWLFSETQSRLDLDKIWTSQTVGQPLLDVLEDMSEVVDAHIRDTHLNVTEYCKKEDCWRGLKSKGFKLPDEIRKEYITGGVSKGYDAAVSSETEAIAFCKSKGSEAWFALSKWLKERDYLTPKARSQSFNMGRTLANKKEPSVALSIPCMKIWKDAEMRGWNPDE